MDETPMDESAPERPSTTMGDEAAARPESQTGAPEAAAEPSRAGKFARRALRWVTAVVVIFGLGFGATWLVRVRPLMDQVEDLEQQVDEAVAAQTQLEQQVEQLEGVEQRNQELESELLEARGHLDLLAVLVDVTRAQLAIAQEDSAAAHLALEDTQEKVEALAEKVDDQDVAAILDRLQLVQEEIETDVFAAQRDLEVLSNTLVAMERDLFGTEN